MRRHRCGKDTDRRQPGDENEQPCAEPRDEGVAARIPCELAIGRADGLEPVVLATVEHELGCAAEQLDEIAVSSPRATRVPPPGRTGERAREQRHADAGDEQSDREDQRRQPEGSARPPRRRPLPTSDRGGRRPDAPQVEALQRVDVADHPADEIAAPEALELRGRERLDPLVEPRSDVPERAQSKIVRDQAIEVAGERS